MPRLHPGLLAGVLCAFALNCSTNLLAQSASPSDGTSTSLMASRDSGELPDSPGTIWAQSQESPQQNTSQENTSAQPADPQSQSQTSAKQDDKPQRPVGTAAAEAPKVSGITAAQPSGVAIAPGKQRRVRTIVLKVGAILGAGAAVGTVIALSAATPSKPPGAH